MWVNKAGDLADPPMRQPEIADRTELAQGLAAAGFAVALAAIGGLARKSLDKRAAAEPGTSRHEGRACARPFLLCGNQGLRSWRDGDVWPCRRARVRRQHYWLKGQ